MAEPGWVYLVGAGPGDPGLLTARALELIASADVILHDRLIPGEALLGARPDAELVYVGKEGEGNFVPQEQTEALMLERAQAGRSVVRLKGGDPFVFGRGGEEAERLREAGVPFEVVPGVSAGVAAPAYAGIPVTHRDRASAVALVTGHEDPAKEDSALDWPALAAFPGTLVFYMGVGRLPRIAEALIAAGRPASEPAAVVERGTLPGQRTVLGTLGDLPERAAAAGVRPPSLIVVGSVAELAGRLAWRRSGPLEGVSVAVTRARAQASELAARLRRLGAQVIEAPAIRTVSLQASVPDLAAFDLLCLTSPVGARELLAALGRDGRDARALAGLRVAAIGPGTAAALLAGGVRADVVPERFVAEGLVEALADVPVRRALVARASEARETLPEALRERGAEVEVLALYRTVAETPEPATLARALSADWITFTSSSTVRFLAEAAGDALRPAASTRIASIGPQTTIALRERGLEPDVEARRHDVEGLVDALLEQA